MPTYKVKGPDGRTVTLRGETPPTEDDLDEIFANLPPIEKTQQVEIPAYGGSKAFKKFGVAGPTGYFSEPGSEDILPAMGQAIGGSIPGINTFGSSVAGSMSGEAGRQSIKALRRGKIPINPIMENAGSVFGEGVRTGIVEGVFRTPGMLIGKIPGAANRMMLSVLKPSRDVIKKNPRFGLDAAELGIVGSKEKMLGKSESLIKQYEDELAKLLKGDKRINAESIVKQLDRAKEVAVKGLKNEDAVAIETVKQNFINQLPKKQVPVSEIDELGMAIKGEKTAPDYHGMNLEKGQGLKKAIYSETPDSAFNRSMQENPGATEARRLVASGIRKEIAGAEPKVAPILKKESTAITAKKALENALANEQKKVLFSKLGHMGAGGIALSGHPMGALGVLAGDAYSEGMRSAPIITGAASNLLKAKRFFDPINKFGIKYGRPVVTGTTEGVRRLFGG